MLQKNIIYIHLILITQLFIGCSLHQEPLPREIDVVIIKNSSYASIQQVSLSADFSKPGRMASISPVIFNAEQVFERPAQRKRLPNYIDVRWVDYYNRVYLKRLHLEPQLISASKNKKKTLVIDFLEDNQIETYLRP